MFISKNKYEELLETKKLKDELEKEVKRLADLISSQTKDCKVGVWCEDCIHMKRDRAVVAIHDYFLHSDFVVAEGGNVMYCKKHLHEICPEHEQKKYN